MSDFIGNRVGMRGRMWWLFFNQMTGAVLCIILGIDPVRKNLANTIGVMIVFSWFIEVASQPCCVIYFQLNDIFSTFSIASRFAVKSLYFGRS